jgi:hypothetical protein
MMTRRVAIAVLLSGLSVSTSGTVPAAQTAQGSRPAADNLVLITLDGARTQELFQGLDAGIVKSMAKGGPVEEHPLYREFWAETPEARRAKLMPFLWNTVVANHGSIAGNRWQGSQMLLTNRHRFSYPGYAEILTGMAHDDVIDTNDNKRYGFETLFEHAQRELKLTKAQVAVFGSWETFNFITEHREGALTVNAGVERLEETVPSLARWNQEQFDIPTPWDGVRHDFHTFRLAMTYLETVKPRVLYMALGQPDDWMHDGRYDRAVQSLRIFDGYLAELWATLERLPEYRGRTAVVITTDHGRGDTGDGWRSHGKDVEGAQYVWAVFAGAGWTRRGEWRSAPTIYQNQLAATMLDALSVRPMPPAPGRGAPVEGLHTVAARE